MISNGKLVQLGDVARFINGRAFKPSEWSKSGLPIIRIQNLNDDNASFNYFEGEIGETHLVQNGDLLVSWSASLDAYIWKKDRAALNQHIFKVVEDKKVIDKTYLYYALREVMQEIRDQTHGATMKHINKGEFESVEIPLPPLPEQKRIAAILTEQLAIAEKARKASETRLEAARALPAAYLRQVFESKEAGIWPKVKLQNICLGNGQYGTSQISNGEGKGLPVLGMKHIQNGRIFFKDVLHVELPEKELDKYLLKKGDLIFNRTNSAELVGKTAVFDLDVNTVFASYLIRFRINDLLADSRFISAFINSRLGRIFIENNMARAIGQVNISASTMNEMIIPLPPINFQRKIMDEFAFWRREYERLNCLLSEESETILKLPASLLRQAFSGAL